LLLLVVVLIKDINLKESWLVR